MLDGNLIHLLKISEWLSADTISFTHRDTVGWDTEVKRLLPTGDWYDPVPKKWRAIKT